MPRVLISDPMDPKAAEIFRANGVAVDEKPGLAKDELKAIIGDYDGLAIRSATRVTAELLDAVRLSDRIDPVPAFTAEDEDLLPSPQR